MVLIRGEEYDATAEIRNRSLLLHIILKIALFEFSQVIYSLSFELISDYIDSLGNLFVVLSK